MDTQRNEAPRKLRHSSESSHTVSTEDSVGIKEVGSGFRLLTILPNEEYISEACALGTS